MVCLTGLRQIGQWLCLALRGSWQSWQMQRCLQGKIIIHFSLSWHTTHSLSSRSRSTWIKMTFLSQKLWFKIFICLNRPTASCSGRQFLSHENGKFSKLIIIHKLKKACNSFKKNSSWKNLKLEKVFFPKLFCSIPAQRVVLQHPLHFRPPRHFSGFRRPLVAFGPPPAARSGSSSEHAVWEGGHSFYKIVQV